MGLVSELKRHHVPWFALVAAVLYAIAFASSIKPLRIDSLPHTQISPLPSPQIESSQDDAGRGGKYA